MFLPARYTVAAAVFLSASAASAVEDATLSADQVTDARRFSSACGRGDAEGLAVQVMEGEQATSTEASHRVVR